MMQTFGKKIGKLLIIMAELVFYPTPHYDGTSGNFLGELCTNCGIIAYKLDLSSQCDQKIDYNFAQILEKVAKNALKSTLKLNLNVQNISIKPHLKP